MKRRYLAYLTVILCASGSMFSMRAIAEPLQAGRPGATGPANPDQAAADARRWSERLLAAANASNPVEVDLCREELLKPLRGVSGAFLDSYERAAATALNKVIDGGNAHAAVSAIIVFSKIGTERALEHLIEHADSNREKRRYIRLAAARGIADALGGQQVANLEFKAIRNLLKDLRTAVELEDDRYVLHYQLTALLALELQRRTPPNLTTSQIDTLRESFAEALERVAERAAAEPDAAKARELFLALSDVSLELLSLCLTLPPDRADVAEMQLKAAMMSLLKVPVAHWATLRESDDMSAITNSVVNVAVSLLAFFDSDLQVGEQLRNAWNDNDPAAFQKALNNLKPR